MKERSNVCENPACLGLGPEWTGCCHKSDESPSKIAAAKHFMFVQDDELLKLFSDFLPKMLQ